MNRIIRNAPLAVLLAAFCFLGAMSPSSAPATAMRKLSLDELSRAADLIVVGQVKDKEARWVNRRIETSYSIQADEYWKGNAGDSLSFTQLGGDLLKPLPLSMHAEGAPRFQKSERVVLFLQKPRKSSRAYDARAAGSRLPGSLMVVGWSQGKFTVLKDKESGQDKVARLDLARSRIFSKEEMDLLSAAAAQQPCKKLRKDKAAKKESGVPARVAAAKAKARAASPAKASKDSDQTPALDLSALPGLEQLKAGVLKSLK